MPGSFNFDDEEDGYEPMPSQDSERASTRRDSPDYQIAKPDEPPATLPPAPLSNPAIPESYQAPAAPEPASMERYSPEHPQVQQAFAQLNEPSEIPQPGYEQHYTQYRQNRDQAASRVLKSAGIQFNPSLSGGEEMALHPDGTPVWRPHSLDPVKSESGQWVKPSRDARGNWQDVDMLGSKQFSTDLNTGEQYFRDKTNQPVVIGTDRSVLERKKAREERAAIIAQRNSLSAQQQADAALLQEQKEQLQAPKAKLKVFGKTPDKLKSEMDNLGAALKGKPLTGPEADAYQEKVAAHSAWLTQNPAYTDLKKQVDTAEADINAREQLMRERKRQSILLLGDPAAAAMLANGGSPLPQTQAPAPIQTAAKPATPAAPTSSPEAEKVGAPVTAAEAPAQSPEDRVKALRAMSPQDRKAALIAEQQSKNAAPAEDNGVSAAQDFGARILIQNSLNIHRAIAGITRFVGLKGIADSASDTAEGLKATIEGRFGDWVNPAKGNGIGAATAEALGTILSTAPAALAATLAVPAAIAGTAVGTLATAGRIGIGMIPIATQFAAAASSEAHDRAKQEGKSDDDATRDAGKAALHTLKALPVYMVGGGVASAMERAFLPAVINPFLRGASHFLFHSAANVGASTALRAIEGQPLAPDKKGVAQDLAFAAQGVFGAASHQSKFNEQSTLAARAIIAGVEPNYAAAARLSQDASALPEHREQARKTAEVMQANAQEFLKKAGTPADSVKLADYQSQLDEVRGKIDTAAADGDAEAHTALQREADMLGQGFHRASVAVSDAVPIEARKTLSKIIDPQSDFEAGDAMLRSNQAAHFASAEVGSATRALYVTPEQETRIAALVAARRIPERTAQAIVDQHVGLRAARDLRDVWQGKPIEANKAAALRELGLLDAVATPEGGMTMKVTDDALPLLPKGVSARAKAQPENSNIHVTPGDPGDMMRHLIRSGQKRLASDFGEPNAPVKPAATAAPVAEPAPIPTNPPVAPAGNARADIAARHDETAAAVRAKDPELESQAMKTVAQFVAAHRSLFSGIKVEEPAAGGGGAAFNPKTSALAISRADILHAAGVTFRKAEKAGAARAEALEQARLKVSAVLREEVIHLADVKVSTDTETAAMWAELPESVRDAAQRIYTRDNPTEAPEGYSSTQWGREFKRILVQSGEEGGVSELAEITLKELQAAPAASWAGKLKEMLGKIVTFLSGKESKEAQEQVRRVLAKLREFDAQAVDAAAHEASTSPQNELPEPTQAQKEAGNYKKGHVKIGGLDVTIENPAGSVRSGVSKEGKEWSQELGAHYGYVKGTLGADGDHVDVFIKPGAAEDHDGPVFAVNQVDPSTGKFDEVKAVIGAQSPEEARAVYESNYEAGWKGGGDIATFPDHASFKKWAESGDAKKPAATPTLTPQEAELQAAAQREEQASAQEDAMRAEGYTPLLEAVKALGGLPSAKHKYRDNYSGELKRVLDAIQGTRNTRKKGVFVADVFSQNAHSPDDLARKLGFETPHELFEALEAEIATDKPHWIRDEGGTADDQSYFRDAGQLQASRSKDTGTQAFDFGGKGVDEDAIKSAPPRAQNVAKVFRRLSAKVAGGEALTPSERTTFNTAEKELGQKYFFDPSEPHPAVDAALKREQAQKLKEGQDRRLTAAPIETQGDMLRGPTDKQGNGMLFAGRAKDERQRSMDFGLDDTRKTPDQATMEFERQRTAPPEPSKSTQELVKENLGLAATIAKDYRNIPGVDQADVISEARQALVKAARGFDPEHPAPFSAYAGTAIRNALNSMFGKEMRHAKRNELTLDGPASEGQTASERLPGASGDSVSAPIESRETSEQIRSAVNQLGARARDVMLARMEGKTHQQIGNQFGVSKQQIGKIEAAATAAVRKILMDRGMKGVDADGVLYASTAFHGTEAKLDRFDLDKVGSAENGEGYGWGLYFAQREGSTRIYRRNAGNVYQVEIDVKPEQLLHWDKFVASPIEKKLLPYWQKILNEDPTQFKPGATAADVGRSLGRRMTGQELYLQLVQEQGSTKAASEYLRSLGVSGIEYTDGHGDLDSSNYVVFDDSKIKITAENGKPVTAAERSEVLHASRGGDDPAFPVPQGDASKGDVAKKLQDTFESGIETREAAPTASDLAREHEDLAPDIAKEYRDLPGVQMVDVLKESRRQLALAARDFDMAGKERFVSTAGKAIRKALNERFGAPVESLVEPRAEAPTPKAELADIDAKAEGHADAKAQADSVAKLVEDHLTGKKGKTAPETAAEKLARTDNIMSAENRLATKLGIEKKATPSAENAKLAAKLAELPNPDLKPVKEQASEVIRSFGDRLRSIRDALTKLPAFTPFLKAVNKHQADLQAMAADSLNLVKAVREQAPDELSRIGITNWRQAGGNEAKLRIWAHMSDDPRIKAGYEAALHLTPEQKRLAGDIDAFYKEKLALGQREEMLQGGIENYATQIWVDDNGRPIPATGGGKFKQLFSFANPRQFDNFFEGEQAAREAKAAKQPSFKALTKDSAALLGIYSAEYNKVLAARELVKSLAQTKSADGRAIIAPSSVFKKIVEIKDGEPGDVSSGAFKIAREDDTSNFKLLDSPALQKWRWTEPKLTEEGKDGLGATHMELGDAPDGDRGTHQLMMGNLLVHPDYARHLGNILGDSAIRKWMNEPSEGFTGLAKETSRVILKAQAFTKGAMFLASTFHVIHEGKNAAGHRIWPFSMGAKIDLSDPMQRRAIEHGLVVQGDTVSQNQFMEGVGGDPWTAKIPIIGKIAKAVSDFTFHEYIPRMKMKAYAIILQRKLSQYKAELADGRVNVDQLEAKTAYEVNNLFGHLNYKGMGGALGNPTVRHVAGMLVLAPDFTEATMREFADAATWHGHEARRGLLTLAIGTFVVAKVINAVLDKDNDPHLDHPLSVVLGEGHGAFSNREYSLRSRVSDIEHMFHDWWAYSQARYSPLLRGVIEVGSRKNWRSEPVSLTDAARDILAMPIPMTLKSIPGVGSVGATDAQASVRGWQQFVGSMGVKINRYSPMNDVHKWSDEFMKEQGKENPIAAYPRSKFLNLKYALLDDKMDDAKEEFATLVKEQGGSDKVAKGFRSSIFHPVMADRAMRTKFIASLDADKKATFKKAIAERNQAWARFVKISGTSIQPPESAATGN